ncbi:hypothetical protein WN943_015951 [Citrus x changshan-huyou]
MGSNGTVTELQRNSTNWTNVVDEIAKMEKKIFPKHESLARSFDEELKKKNSGLLYIQIHGQIVGYVIYAWPTSLSASITKLAEPELMLRITLHVDPLRTPAVNLYKKFGFQVDALIQGYHSDDRPAYRMYMDFDPK